MQINPLNIATYSGIFGFVLGLSQLGAKNGAIIGLGGDIDIWKLIKSQYINLSAYESDPDWLKALESRLDLIKYKHLPQSYSDLKLKAYKNSILHSAMDQMEYINHLSSIENQTKFSISRDRFLNELTKTDLYNSLLIDMPDWIYVDGPSGGYISKESVYKTPNTGRLETILISCLALANSKHCNIDKWLIVDDADRFIELSSIYLIADYLLTDKCIRIGSSVAIKLKTNLPLNNKQEFWKYFPPQPYGNNIFGSVKYVFKDGIAQIEDYQ